MLSLAQELRCVFRGTAGLEHGSGVAWQFPRPFRSMSQSSNWSRVGKLLSESRLTASAFPVKWSSSTGLYRFAHLPSTDGACHVATRSSVSDFSVQYSLIHPKFRLMRRT